MRSYSSSLPGYLKENCVDGLDRIDLKILAELVSDARASQIELRSEEHTSELQSP